MRAVLRYLHSPDILDLSESYTPADPDCFSFLLQAMFGPDDGPGEESFDILICTPKRLADDLRKSGGILSGRHYLLIEKYDIAQITDFILEHASRCKGQTWREVAEKLGRLGKWEFEDYQPASVADKATE